MGVDPDRPAGAVHLAEPAERPQRHRMVSAEHDRNEAVPRRVADELGDVPARLLDLREEAGLLVHDRRRLRDRSADVAPVDVLVAELDDPRGEAGVPNRGRTHVNTATPGAQIEGRADDGDFAL